MVLFLYDKLFYKKGTSMPNLKKFCSFLNFISRKWLVIKLSLFSLIITVSFSKASTELPKKKKRKVLTLVEYFDLSCPLSAQSSRSLSSFKEKMGDRLSIERRSLAFSKNDLSWLAGKYYHALLNKDKALAEVYYHKVFEQTLKGQMDKIFLNNLIEDLGISVNLNETQLTSPLLEKGLRENEALAYKSGIFVSPGYVFLGQALRGKQEESDFGKVIGHL